MEASVYWIHTLEQTNIFESGLVGVARNPKRRFRRHMNARNNTCYDNIHLSRAVEKYGEENMMLTVVLTRDEDLCYNAEHILRPRKNIGWNIAEGGNRPPPWETGVPRGPRSEETRRKDSEVKQGEKHPMFGKPGTMLGKKHKPETKMKMSIIRKGRPSPRKGRKFGPNIRTTGGEK